VDWAGIYKGKESGVKVSSDLDISTIPFTQACRWEATHKIFNLNERQTTIRTRAVGHYLVGFSLLFLGGGWHEKNISSWFMGERKMGTKA